MKTHPILLGHRGVRRVQGLPENTLAAFDYALAEGCDGFEFDVRLTADGQAVIYHDAGFKRNGRRIEIAGATSEHLALPSLRDVLKRYQNRAFLDIELKVPGLEKITLALLRKTRPSRGFVISSFLPEVLESIHALDANIPLGLICDKKAQLRRWRELPVDYVFPHYRLASQELIRELKVAGKKICVWTMNLTSQMKRFSEWGVDGIISDHPRRLVRAFTPQEK